MYKVFSYFKRAADTSMPIQDIAKAQECTVEACDASIGSVQRIINEDNVAIYISLSLCMPPTLVRVGHFSIWKFFSSSLHYCLF
jgi:hypothetical protein